jgi:hypothetical protein
VSNVAQKCIALKITIIVMAGKPIPRNQKAKSGWMTVVRPSRREKMRAFAVTLLALYLSAGAAAAQTNQEMTWALGEVGEELQVCSVYFTVISGCLQQQEPAISKKYQQGAERLGFLGATSKQSAGVSKEAYLAFSKVLFKALMKAMGGNCTNIAVLLNRYMDFCVQLGQDADAEAEGQAHRVH